MSFKVGPVAVSKGGVFIISEDPYWDPNFETIERKGLGHPDTIADTLAAKISHAYSNYTFKNFDGVVLHHQIDKLMVIGGKSEVHFGGGKFVEPIRIIVGGRASYSLGENLVPVDEIIKKVIFEHFNLYFPLVKNTDILIENYLTSYAGPGTINTSTGAIANMFNPKTKNQVRGYEKLVANDTSYCISYAPLSPLEDSIIRVEKFLNNDETKKLHPWLGTDIKIMAVRNEMIVEITMCIPQIAEYVPSFQCYKDNLNMIGNVIDNMFNELLPQYTIKIYINTKDDYNKMNVYLTVSGASLSGDIGVVGRGNRTNGLITSNRPMSMEGTNGKNPRYYSGFIYANLTKRISRKIFEEFNSPNTVEMVSQNGGLLSAPWRTRVVTKAPKRKVENIINDELNSVESITSSFLEGNIENY